MPRSVRWSAYLCFFHAAIAIFLFVIANTGAMMGFERGATGLLLFFLAFAYCFVPFYVLGFGFLGFGLLRGWGWARWGTMLAFAINAMLTFPFGLITAVPAILLLLRASASRAFERSGNHMNG